MSAKIIDGKEIAATIKKEIAFEVKHLNDTEISVCLAVILVGENAASKVYVNNKKKACELVGIKSASFELPEQTSEKQLLELIGELNKSKEINGILVQLPLPKHIDERKVIISISPEKDVDCFHPQNVGALSIGGAGFLPCTPSGIIQLIKRSGYEIEGKHCVVIGRSNIVGKPVAMLLLSENATVTICHSKTRNLNEICKQGDIVVVATGKINSLTPDMIKSEAIVIDVGINRNGEGKLCGDSDFEGCFQKAEAITPVPGGVGPMTIAMLMKNCVQAAKIQNGI